MILEYLAVLTFYLTWAMGLGVLLAGIFHIDEHNKIKLTIDVIRPKMSKYQKTSLYIAIYFPIIIWEILGDFVKTTLTTFYLSMGWKLIPFSLFLVCGAVFWTTKIQLGRSWKNIIVKISGILALSLFFFWLSFMLYT